MPHTRIMIIIIIIVLRVSVYGMVQATFVLFSV